MKGGKRVCVLWETVKLPRDENDVTLDTSRVYLMVFDERLSFNKEPLVEDVQDKIGFKFGDGLNAAWFCFTVFGNYFLDVVDAKHHAVLCQVLLAGGQFL